MGAASGSGIEVDLWLRWICGSSKNSEEQHEALNLTSSECVWSQGRVIRDNHWSWVDHEHSCGDDCTGISEWSEVVELDPGMMLVLGVG